MYKAILSWLSEGVRITVEVEPPGLPDLVTEEMKEECHRRAQLIVDHFRLIIPSAKVEVEDGG